MNLRWNAIRAMAVAALAIALSAGVASAHPHAWRIDAREWRQHARIRDGWRSGDLTAGERWRLRAGQWRIRRMERLARRDGRLTFRERHRINRAQDRESRRIYRLRQNRFERGVWS